MVDIKTEIGKAVAEAEYIREHNDVQIAINAIEKMADYLLPVKGNHKRLEENLDNFFNKFCLENEAGARTLEKSHGRMEERFCWHSYFTHCDSCVRE